MPAKLIVVDGASAGAELWIEYEVLRFGSDASCELALSDPAVEPHALTLRYGDGRYTVFNRGSAPLTLDSLTIAPSESGHWRAGKTLRLAGGPALKLEITGDPAPARRPADAYVPPVATGVEAAGVLPTAGGEGDDAAAAAKPEKSSTAAILVGLLMAAAAMFLLFSDEFLPADTSAAAAAAPPEFAEMVSLLQTEPECASDLWVLLSQAYAEAYRGDEDRAAAAYCRLRDRIVWEKNLLLTQGRPIPAALDQAERYVKHQLTSEL